MNDWRKNTMITKTNMDTKELSILFKQKLENALNSKENFKGKYHAKFIEIKDGMCDFHYKGQEFSVLWWTWEEEQCIECSCYCREVLTTEIDFDQESFDYSLELPSIYNENDIDECICKIIEGIKNCYIADNVYKILKIAKKMAKDIEYLDGNEADNKLMLERALRYFYAIN